MSLRFPFEAPLVPGKLIRRYKRFLADIDIGHEVTAHCPNPGSMLGMNAPGSNVMLRRVDDPRRKLPWTLEMIQVDGTWVGCNTMRPNQVAEWAIRQGLVPSLRATTIRREVRVGDSRIDLLLDEDHFVEIKNTTLARGNVAAFPDSVTARGAKHMRELASIAEKGKASILFFVNRSDCDRFEVAADIDPAYAEAFQDAMDAGVNVVILGLHLDPTGWTVRGELPLSA